MNSLFIGTLITVTLVIGTSSLHAPKGRVPTIPRQIVFVIGISPSRYRHKKKGDFVLTSKYDVITLADVDKGPGLKLTHINFTKAAKGVCIGSRANRRKSKLHNRKVKRHERRHYGNLGAEVWISLCTSTSDLRAPSKLT